MCGKKLRWDEREKSKVAGLKQTKFCLGRLRELPKILLFFKLLLLTVSNNIC
jgi:hypothetical protein